MMKPHDNRRLKAFVKDEEEAAKEYTEMALLMEKSGYFQERDIFLEMAEDEAKHARMNIAMINMTPR